MFIRWILLGTLFFTACSTHQALSFRVDANNSYFDYHSGLALDENSMVDKLIHYDVIFIGDHHNETKLYKKIASLIEKLSQTKKVHFASEWFTPHNQKLLDAYINSDINETSFQDEILWKKNIGFKFESLDVMYRALMKYHGKLYGINLSREERKKISKQNFKDMSESEKSFYERLDLNVTAHHAMLKPYFDECHAYSDATCSERMYRVQVAWDSKMAEQSSEIVNKLSKDEVLVVLVGAMHLENRLGVNLRFARSSKKHSYTLMPQENHNRQLPIGRADGVIFYEKTLNRTK
jgi:uncharacterized iron-regulated protein